MAVHGFRRTLLPAAIAAASMTAGGHATAQTVPLHYESLSSVEEPLAVDVGDATFILTGLVDARWTVDTEGDDDTDAGLIGNFQINALTQLANRWRVDLSYFGQHASDPTSVFGTGDGYTDNAALSVASYWGTVSGGNVSGLVREQTRRLRSAGNAVLAFDDFLGALQDRSAGYTGRFGPWIVSAAVDEDGDLDLGAIFQRPAGTRDWRVALRAVEGTFVPAGGRRLDSRGFGIVGEVIYGSTTVDAGAAHEHFWSKGNNADRWYVASGVRTKTGALTLSLEGQIGRIEGKGEASAALGVQYDVARGLSANLGLNHAKARVIHDDARFLDIEETKTVLSLRYSF
ncbi:MAG: hypothetical protein OXC11_07275 [Rhodospirillales bacterium]|nr:hypothetical protein [Rhodospirillales bacterium]